MCHSLVQCDVSSISLPMTEASFLVHGDKRSELYSTQFTSVHWDLSAEVKTSSLWSFLLGPQHLMLHSKQTDEFPLPPVSRCWSQHCVHLFWIYKDRRAPCTCIGDTAAAGAVLTGIPLRGLLGTLWTGTFCPLLPARKNQGNIWISNPTITLLSDQGTTVWCHSIFMTKNTHPEATSRSCSLLKISFTTKYNVQIPEHPKSNDFISDFTVAADSGGVGDALLRQTPCQRLAVSDSTESTSSAASLQGTKHSTVRATGRASTG